MKKNEQYFNIKLSMLPTKSNVYPFHLYVYNPLNKTHAPFLYANSPFTDNKKLFIELIEKKGGSLSVDLKQKKTFLFHTHIDVKEIPGLVPFEKSPLLKAHEIYKTLHEQHLEDNKLTPFNFKVELSKAIEEDNFTTLIEEAKIEIMAFSITISHTVSLATFLCEKLMPQDNPINRIVILCFFTLKQLKINDEEKLGEIICAAYLHHLGFTQMERSLSLQPFKHLKEKEKGKYRKHGGLTQHLLRKMNIDLNKNVIDYIINHHERTDGTGYPFMKIGDNISTMEQVLGLVSHIVDYSSGRINGNAETISSTIRSYKNESYSSGLENGFSDKIIEQLTVCLDMHNKEIVS